MVYFVIYLFTSYFEKRKDMDNELVHIHVSSCHFSQGWMKKGVRRTVQQNYTYNKIKFPTKDFNLNTVWVSMNQYMHKKFYYMLMIQSDQIKMTVYQLYNLNSN